MPKCPRCSKEVYPAEEVMAASQKWHNVCFRCKECKTALNSSNLRDREKEIYCNHCYAKLFGAKGFGFGGAASSVVDGAVAEPLHGTAAIDAAIQRKLNLKYDETKEQKARAFLENLLGERFEEKNLHEALKSGERLCNALNKVYSSRPVKNVNKSKFAAAQRENIANYINACKILAFNKSENFETADLFEGSNMVQVIENIFALGRRAVKNGMSGIPGEIDPAVYSSSSGGGASEPEPTPAAAPAASAAASEPAPAAAAAAEPEPAPAAEVAASEPAAEAAAEVTACPDCGAARVGAACPDCGYSFA